MTNINLLFAFKGVFMVHSRDPSNIAILNLASANFNIDMVNGVQAFALLNPCAILANNCPDKIDYVQLISDDDIDDCN